MSSFSSESNINQAHAYSKKEWTQMEQRVHKNLGKEFIMRNHSDSCSFLGYVVKDEISDYKKQTKGTEKDSTP